MVVDEVQTKVLAAAKEVLAKEVVPEREHVLSKSFVCCQSQNMDLIALYSCHRSEFFLVQ